MAQQNVCLISWSIKRRFDAAGIDVSKYSSSPAVLFLKRVAYSSGAA